METTMDNLGASESNRLGKRAAEDIGSAVDAAGQKLDAAVDYLATTKQSAQRTLARVRQDGWKGTKARVMEYTRSEPVTALLIAVGAGLVLGWLTKRTRG
jgi:ElaB/YqjD/DUF883 family membrane-anchored ribosome-binding protein